MEVCMSAEYGMLDACVRSHEVSNDEMTRCACAVCQIPIAMKFAAFLFATISAAARLQQTSEESHDSLDQVVRPPRLEEKRSCAGGVLVAGRRREWIDHSRRVGEVFGQGPAKSRPQEGGP
ncbi:unnamed protein product [Durusdinium trenchii]|uniref:Uncharacterized protein n=1 Tax=Durusdinium trenchii TaxID=1381693 RepID=A0ABP0NZB9_9DINO